MNQRSAVVVVVLISFILSAFILLAPGGKNVRVKDESPIPKQVPEAYAVPEPMKPVYIPVEETSVRLPRFLYLVQTEACLPEYLASLEVLGNPLACQCDVLVLGYKQTCENTSLSHVEHLFNSSTTWSTGRNLLLSTAMNRSEKYVYYIFMDDDIVLINPVNDRNPWREFEEFLLRIGPALAAIELGGNKCLPAVYDARRIQGCGVNKSAECLPVVRFDPAFNAFHSDAVQYLLPYSTTYEAESWWTSRFYVAIKAELMFRGQVVIHNLLRANNLLHRPYPRKGYKAAPILREIEKDIPEEYRNSNLFRHWKKYGLQHERNSRTLCLPPPQPHMPIQPYAHFKSTATGL